MEEKKVLKKIIQKLNPECNQRMGNLKKLSLFLKTNQGMP